MMKSKVFGSSLVVSFFSNKYQIKAKFAGKVRKTKAMAMLTKSLASLCSRILLLLDTDQFLRLAFVASSTLGEKATRDWT